MFFSEPNYLWTASTAALDERPHGFDNWNKTVQVVMDAREQDVMSDNVDEGVWEVFETMAFVLMSKINP